jgi:hypothetical protein
MLRCDQLAIFRDVLCREFINTFHCVRRAMLESPRAEEAVATSDAVSAVTNREEAGAAATRFAVGARRFSYGVPPTSTIH